MSAADVAALLGDARREAGGRRCRRHGGRSLVLRDGEDGRLLATCWAGCNRASWVRPAQPDGQGRSRGDWHSLQPAASSRFTVLTHKKNLNVHRISLVRSTTA